MQSQPEFCLVPIATGRALSESRSLTQVQFLSEADEPPLWCGSASAPYAEIGRESCLFSSK
jgi:hypothetical protein